MSGADWSRAEVEAIVDDYLSMLTSELAGTRYNKAAHRRALLPRLGGRSDQSVEFKHANISAALLAAGFPYISGYKPRSNYQALLGEVALARVNARLDLLTIAAADADRPIAVPEVENILSVLVPPPQIVAETNQVREPSTPKRRLTTNYIEREARNQSLGAAGELFALNYERARLIAAGKEALAAKVEHTSKVRGDHEGFELLGASQVTPNPSFEPTRYGRHCLAASGVSTHYPYAAKQCLPPRTAQLER